MYVLCAAEWSFRAIAYRFVHRRTSRFGSRFGSKRIFKNMVELFCCKMQEKAPKSLDFGAFYGGQYRTRTRLTVFESCFAVFCGHFLCCRCSVLCCLMLCGFWPCFCRKAKNKAKFCSHAGHTANVSDSLIILTVKPLSGQRFADRTIL